MLPRGLGRLSCSTTGSGARTLLWVPDSDLIEPFGEVPRELAGMVMGVAESVLDMVRTKRLDAEEQGRENLVGG